MKRILAIGCTVLIAFTGFSQSDYVKKELEKRKKKDTMYKMGSHSNRDAHGHSPLLTEDKAKFKALSYFEPNEEYIVDVDFIQYKNPDHATLGLTNGHNHHYWVVGKIVFKLNGKDCELLVYQDKKYQEHHKEYKEYMFIPFRDQTNGYETYGGGRYIQWHDPHGNHDKIDFNDAFNPASAYNPSIADPIVPYINTLPVRVEAGEKDFVIE